MMVAIFLPFFLFLANHNLVFAQNPAYCDPVKYGLYAQDGTLCKYSAVTPGPACGKILRGVDVMTPPIQNYIVGYHNNLRLTVATGKELRGSPGPQPAAKNMLIVNWNPQLALAAQTWANQCKFQSDANRNETIAVVPSPTTAPPTTNPVYVGQNVYGFIDTPATYNYNDFSSPNAYWEQAISRWYNEVRLFNSSVVRNYTYQRYAGHYAQIVADRTILIGCGFNQWQMPNSDRTARILICNYGPSGLIPGEPVYVTV